MPPVYISILSPSLFFVLQVYIATQILSFYHNLFIYKHLSLKFLLASYAAGLKSRNLHISWLGKIYTSTRRMVRPARPMEPGK